MSYQPVFKITSSLKYGLVKWKVQEQLSSLWYVDSGYALTSHGARRKVNKAIAKWNAKFSEAESTK